MNQTIEVRKNGHVIIHLGSGSGLLHVPEGITPEQAREIACEQFPLGSHSRRKNIVAALCEITGAGPFAVYDYAGGDDGTTSECVSGTFSTKAEAQEWLDGGNLSCGDYVVESVKTCLPVN